MNKDILTTRIISENTSEKYVLDPDNIAHIEVIVYLKPKAMDWRNLMELEPEIMTCIKNSIRHETNAHGENFVFRIRLYIFKTNSSTENTMLLREFVDLCVLNGNRIGHNSYVDIAEGHILYLDTIKPISIVTFAGPYHSHWIGFNKEEIIKIKSRIKREIITFEGSKQGKESINLASSMDEPLIDSSNSHIL